MRFLGSLRIVLCRRSGVCLSEGGNTPRRAICDVLLYAMRILYVPKEKLLSSDSISFASKPSTSDVSTE